MENCENCIQLNSIVKEQKEKIILIETRLKDLVKAYKKVCYERDVLIDSNNTNKQTQLFFEKQQQERLLSLESRIAEMSSICGKYESEKIKDNQTIERLTTKCEQLNHELNSHKNQTKSDGKEDDSSKRTNKIARLKNRSTQTDDLEKQIKTTNKNNMQKRIDVETQTEVFEDEKVNRKCELAIVLPTQRNESPSQDESFQTEIPELNPSPSTIASPSPPLQSAQINPTPSPTNTPFPIVTSIRSRNNSETLFSGTSHSGVSLFYANELARKEIDLAETKIQAREYECALRELQWKYNVDKFR